MRQKTVFLFCTDEDRRGILAFTLRTNGYHVVGAIPPVADMALLVDDLSCKAVAKDIARSQPELPIVVLAGKFRRYLPYSQYPVGVGMLKSDTSMETLIWRIRIATSRKRGPRGPRVQVLHEKSNEGGDAREGGAGTLTGGPAQF